MEYSKEAVDRVIQKMEYEILNHSSRARAAASRGDDKTAQEYQARAMVTTETLTWFKDETGL